MQSASPRVVHRFARRASYLFSSDNSLCVQEAPTHSCLAVLKASGELQDRMGNV